MDIKGLKEALKVITTSNGVPFILSAPGIGKSDSVKQFAQSVAKERKLGFYEGPENYNPKQFGFIDLRLATVDVIDLQGLPLIDKEIETTKFTRSPYIPAEGQGILFLDELPQAKAGNQAAISQLILDKRVGSHALGDGWKIICAGNRMKDRAATHKMPTHIANRLTFLDLDFSIDLFIDYMNSLKVDNAVSAFARFRPEILESFSADNDINCTPRSFMSAIAFLQEKEELRYPLIAGTVGEGPAAEMIGFIDVYNNLPDFSKFVKSPEVITIPSKSDILYATIQMLAAHVTDTTVDKINVFINRLSNTPEYVVMFWKTAIAKHTALALCQEFKDFAAKNKDILI